jgi:hypothetical protein
MLFSTSITTSAAYLPMNRINHEKTNIDSREMIEGSVFLDGLFQEQRLYCNILKGHIIGSPDQCNIVFLVHSLLPIIDHLSAVYPRHSSSNVLKCFSVRLNVHKENFTATAVAELKPPASLMDVLAFVLEDEFIRTDSAFSALDALEQLCEEVTKKFKEGTKGMYADV